MSFPWHQPLWRETADFLQGRTGLQQRILAPDAFWWIVSRIDRYVPDNLDPSRSYDWVVLDAHDMPQVPRKFLASVAESMTPVYANDRFVVWAADTSVEAVPDLVRRMTWFGPSLEQLTDEPQEPNRYVNDLALADAPQLMRFADLSDGELRVAMNEFHARTGYQYPTLRDERYHQDMQAETTAFIDRCSGRVLDLASGGYPFVEVPEGTQVVRTELSEVAIRHAREGDVGRPALLHLVADAHRVPFPDRIFDGATIVDALEHVRDVSVVFREAARVLIDGGRLLVTFANRRSLHEIIVDKLGYPPFPTNHQHIREFTVPEARDLLDDAGFDVEDTAGVDFLPYWGVPGIDEVVRPITDNDPEVVELMSELGRRVGADHAYTSVLSARRRTRPIVLITPLPPAATGNGLAMRAGMLLDALRAVASVHVVVIPVAGPADDCEWASARAASVTTVPPVTGPETEPYVTAQLADADLRLHLERTAPLPTRAAAVPPTLSSAVLDALPSDLGPVRAVVGMRLYLAPLGVHLARALEAEQIVVDADDDDVALLFALGDDEQAESYDRLGRAWLPDADVVLAASAVDAERISERTGHERVVVAPNAVDIPGPVPPPPHEDRLLLVGNLTYEPNRIAARLAAEEILPILRRSRPAATLEIVGRHDGSLDDLAGLPGVHVCGEVPDVSPCYARTDLALVPLRHGAGTRIKVLEAFAHHRPVVATPTAVTGLAVRDGNEVLLGESPAELADAADRLLGDGELATALREHAAHLVATRYSLAAVAPIVQSAVLGAPAAAAAGGSVIR